MAKEKEAKAVEAVVDTAKETEKFINQMESPAKARRAAVRLLQNRKVGK